MQIEMNEQTAYKIAKLLLDIEAVTLRPQQPYTWTSGIKAPIYCDNRITISYPIVREALADAFVSLIQREYPDVELIAGPATGGIPHAAWVAQKMALPMIYVRGKAKGHGKQTKIEGVLKPDQKTVVIEDLISTGGSSIDAAKAVNEDGGNVLTVLSIFAYGLPVANDLFEDAGLTFQSLTNFETLLEVAEALGGLNASDIELLKLWKRDPKAYDSKFS